MPYVQNYIDEVRSDLRGDEGTGPTKKVRGKLRFYPYQDSEGIWTIGYGRNIEQKGISQDEADSLLEIDILEAYNDCIRVFPWFKGLDTVRSQVILNMAFNMGAGKVKRFKRMIASIIKEEWHNAAIHMLDSKYARQTKGRAVRLANRLETGER